MDKKTILITGCSRGIGFHLALLLAKNGHTVFANVRTKKNCSLLLKKSKALKNLSIVEFDITREEQVYDFFSRITTNKIEFDVLINNAASILFGPVECVTIEEIEKQFQLNFFAPVRLIQQVIPGMRRSRKGLIINIGSTSGVQPEGMYPFYCASKSALDSLTFGLSSNLKKWNIQAINAVVSATHTTILDYSLSFGSKNLKDKKEYEKYIENSFSILKKVISDGSEPQIIAEKIAEIISNVQASVRIPITEKANAILNTTYKDPQGRAFFKEIEKEIGLF